MKDPVLPAFPCLADGLELVYGPGNDAQLRGVTPPIRLTGGLARRLLPLLDGSRPVPAILADMNDWPQEEVLRALEMLSSRGLIGTGPVLGLEPARSQAAFYWSATTGPVSRGEEVLQTLARAKIQLFGWGALAKTIAETLRTCGSEGLVAEFWAPPPGVAAAESLNTTIPFPEPAELGEGIRGWTEAGLVALALPRPAPGLTFMINEACINRGIAFLPIVVNGVEATVGPTVIGGRSACYNCFKLRLSSNTPFPADDSAYECALDTPPSRVTLAEWPAFTTAVASFAAMEAIRLVTSFVPPVTLGQACFLHALTGQVQVARVWKIPRCPVCSRVPGPGGGDDRGEDHRQPEPDR